MAFKITFWLGDFPDLQTQLAQACQVARIMIDALTSRDEVFLQWHPATPSIYASGVRYRFDRFGEENWFDIPTSLELGYGDCKVFTAWRVAELRRQGVKCWPDFSWRWVVGPHGQPMVQIHYFVRFPDRRVEDPSRVLGMPVRSDLDWSRVVRAA